METTLRSVRRGVGHTHGWLRKLGRQRRREEATEKEAEGDNSCGCSGTLPEDQLNQMNSKTRANLFSFSFLSFSHPTLLQPLMHSSYILHGPIQLGGAYDCDSSLEKRISVSIFTIRLIEQ